ncbi:MAG: FAD-dependent oxidoreductase [Ruminococcaceae bacterium]|nr:FAD-dependent oxidoreductase [Oscillospiraceae bacterium]
MRKYDVAVVGGGFAGVAAAVAAARAGAKVFLVEKGNSLGGAAVNCLVMPFMRYWTEIDGKRVDLSAGIFSEINQKLKESDALNGKNFLEEGLKLVLNDMVEKENIDVLYHGYLFDVKSENGKISSLTFATVGGAEEVCADYFIDATGDAQLAFLSDCETTLGRDGDHLCQPMTLCFRVGNADVERFWANRDKLNEKYKEALARGEFINPREDILVFRTPIKNVLHFNTTRVVKKNPTNAFEVTEAEIIARKQVREIYEFMKKHAEGLEDSFLMMTASEIGVRESRKIVGEYVLTEQECRDCVKFEDAVVACNYDIDIHNPEGAGTSHHYFAPGTYYTIPYRCLQTKEYANLLVAGRCISSDHGAQASYRIMPTVCCIGEAAGTAVGIALAEKSSVKDISIERLQKTLKANGAFIGI